jgi:3-keto-5-aminohexanoate cleavage enzyme
MDVILNLAPTGMVATREMNPHVPLQVHEIVADTLRCAEQGITIVHLHARDEQGLPTHRKDVYARIIAGIREEREDLVLCVSCSGRSVAELEARAEVLSLANDLRPDMASLTLSSLNFPGQVSINPPDVIIGLAERMAENGIKPELEIFDLGMANYAHYLLERGVIRQPLYANLFFGSIASAQPTLMEMAAMTQALPAGTVWSFAGVGRTQRQAASLAIALGGGVRMGLEDNIWANAERSRLDTNLAQVQWVRALSELQQRFVMSPVEFRKRFHLPGPD